MKIKAISETLQQTIAKLQSASSTDQQELKQITAFSIKAIGTLEALIDTIMEPLKKAKSSLYGAGDTSLAKSFLVEIVTEMYEELDEAQDMVFKFQSLTTNFDTQISPMLSKYLTSDEVQEWAGLFDMTSQERGAAFARVESLLPKIESFLDVRFESWDESEQAQKLAEMKSYVNEVIAETRTTKKQLQSIKFGFLQLSGLQGILKESENDSASSHSDFSNQFKKIKDSVAHNQIEKALELLEDLCNLNYPDFLKEVIMLQSQFHKTRSDFYLGLDNDKLTQNRINFAILEIVDRLEKLH